MRLTCPNCDAQYEVDDRAIPETGRDVQCSNCGHAWFQLPPDLEIALEEGAEAAAELRAHWPEPAPDHRPEPEPAPQAASPAARPIPAWPAPDEEFEPELEPDLEPDFVPPPAAAAPVLPPEEGEPAADFAPRLTPAPQRRTLDDKIQAVLREEAERERQARAGEIAAAPGFVGAVAPEPAEPVEDEGEGGAAPRGARRDLLPDIEQLNSTLRASNPPEPEAEERPGEAEAEAPRQGFRLGLRLVLVLVVVVVALYLLAPEIAAKVPALAPAMHLLQTTIDGYRAWLDQVMLSAVKGLGGQS